MERVESLREKILQVCSDIENEIRIYQRINICMPSFGQIKRSSTSIGANYCESMGCHTERDYRKTVGIALKECYETMWWIDILNNDLTLTNYENISQTLSEIKKSLEKLILYSADTNSIPTKWGRILSQKHLT